ncbi:hypothetical protein WDJ50_02545 [Deinococcus sp. VB142]|uniref:Uncharacterized protein n=1 Tax=Deinococcus sp. VB142 TaxID=3112952 RepID=A0AAU6Q417_9DEIO
MTPTKPRMIFATKTLQQQKFPLGDREFFSTRLTGEEEIVYQEGSTLASFGMNLPQQTRANLDMYALFLNHRIDGPAVDAEWTGQYLGPSNVLELMAYLRTGHNGPGIVPAPGMVLDLPELPQDIEIGGRVFGGRALSYNEYLHYLDSLPDEDMVSIAVRVQQEGDANPIALLNEARQVVSYTSATRRAQAGAVAAQLSVRILDGGEAVSGEWILEHLSIDEVAQVFDYLRTGKLEADSPNDSTPANLPISG